MSSFRNGKAYCIGCGRVLHRNSGSRCTNCGRAFSICDRASWASGPWQGRLRRLVSGPPNWVDAAVAAAAAAFTLLAFAAPGRFGMLFQMAVLLWLGAISLWLLRLLDRIVDHFGDRSTMPRPEFLGRMAAMPVLLALSLWLVAAHLPVRMGFMMSRSEFERLARDLHNSPGGELRAGWYTLMQRSIRGDESTPLVHLSAAGDVLGEKRQFVYAPAGLGGDDPRYKPLAGQWYLFSDGAQ